MPQRKFGVSRDDFARLSNEISRNDPTAQRLGLRTYTLADLERLRAKRLPWYRRRR